MEYSFVRWVLLHWCFLFCINSESDCFSSAVLNLPRGDQHITDLRLKAVQEHGLEFYFHLLYIILIGMCFLCVMYCAQSLFWTVFDCRYPLFRYRIINDTKKWELSFLFDANGFSRVDLRSWCYRLQAIMTVPFCDPGCLSPSPTHSPGRKYTWWWHLWKKKKNTPNALLYIYYSIYIYQDLFCVRITALWRVYSISGCSKALNTPN